MTAEEPRLPNRVRFYIGFLFLLGAVALGQAAVGWASPDLFKFAGFLAIHSVLWRSIQRSRGC